MTITGIGPIIASAMLAAIDKGLEASALAAPAHSECRRGERERGRSIPFASLGATQRNACNWVKAEVANACLKSRS